MREIGEFGLIDRLTARLKYKQPGVIVGIGDDAAVLRYPADCEIVATTDALVEGVHFRSDTISVHNLGYKAVAASISDVAAMGGEPLHVLLSLAIPPQTDVAMLEAVYDGIAEITEQFNCSVVGGDVVKTDGPLVINVTVLGAVKRGQALLRSGAKAGDIVFVTGFIGGSAAGLAYRFHEQQILQATVNKEDLQPDLQLDLQQVEDYITMCHERPQPQVHAGQILSRTGVCHSCDDISDGLASELNEIAKASQVTIEIWEKDLPIHPYVREAAQYLNASPYDWALYGGEDYQLVGTVPAQSVQQLIDQFQADGLMFYPIGEVTGMEQGVWLHREHERMLLRPSGYNHFRE